MKVSRRIARVRCLVKDLVALAGQRAVQTDSNRDSARFRLLTEGEARAIVGDDLLSLLAGARRRA